MTAALSGLAPAPSDGSVRLHKLGAFALRIAALVATVIGVWFGLRSLGLDLPDLIASFPVQPSAIDGHRQLLAVSVLASGGDPYSVFGYLYPPLGAIVLWPFSLIGDDAALWAWLAVKVAIASWCVVDATRGASWALRVLALVAVFTSTFVLDDLWLGNSAILMAAAIYVAVSRESAWAGIPLGLILAVVAKPFLVPVLFWLLVFRRRRRTSRSASACLRWRRHS